MIPVHEARFYEPLADMKVLCTLCPHDCRIPNGGRGACSVRYTHCYQCGARLIERLSLIHISEPTRPTT